MNRLLPGHKGYVQTCCPIDKAVIPYVNYLLNPLKEPINVEIVKNVEKNKNHF
jgi:hypothetical protein